MLEAKQSGTNGHGWTSNIDVAGLMAAADREVRARVEEFFAQPFSSDTRALRVGSGSANSHAHPSILELPSTINSQPSTDYNTTKKGRGALRLHARSGSPSPQFAVNPNNRDRSQGALARASVSAPALLTALLLLPTRPTSQTRPTRQTCQTRPTILTCHY